MLIAEWILIGAGCAVVVVSTLAALLMPSVFGQVHAPTAVTTVGAPLIGVGVALQNGWSAASGLVVIIVAIMAVTGPAITAATARMAAQRLHVIEAESPE